MAPNLSRLKPEASSILDHARLSDDQRAELLATFADGLLERIEQIEDGLRCCNLVAVTKAVHALHGTAAVFGFERIAESALGVEREARENGEFPKVQAGAEELLAICRETLA